MIVLTVSMVLTASVQGPRVSAGASDQEEAINWGKPPRIHSGLVKMVPLDIPTTSHISTTAPDQDGSQSGSASNSWDRSQGLRRREKEKVRHIQMVSGRRQRLNI